MPENFKKIYPAIFENSCEQKREKINKKKEKKKGRKKHYNNYKVFHWKQKTLKR